MKKKLFVALLLLMGAFMMGSSVFAATPTPAPVINNPSMCQFAQAGDPRDKCEACFKQGSAWTAVGCIKTSPQGFIQQFLGLGIGIGGGIAFLLILFGGFQMMTSAGNPERLTAAKELVGAAISGLLLIIFSLFLLRIIGYDILRIPGFK